MSFAIKFSHFCRRISHEFFASVHPLSAMHFMLLIYCVIYCTANFSVKCIVLHDLRKIAAL
jgi:hypothetical protein